MIKFLLNDFLPVFPLWMRWTYFALVIAALMLTIFGAKLIVSKGRFGANTYTIKSNGQMGVSYMGYEADPKRYSFLRGYDDVMYFLPLTKEVDEIISIDNRGERRTYKLTLQDK